MFENGTKNQTNGFNLREIDKPHAKYNAPVNTKTGHVPGRPDAHPLPSSHKRPTGGAAGVDGFAAGVVGKLMSLVGSLRPLVGGIFFLVMSPLLLRAQGQELIEQVTTVISMEITADDGSTVEKHGTAIFYHDSHPTKGDRYWIVSNRHVLLPDEKIPNKIILHLRVWPNPNAPPYWHDVLLNQNQIRNLLRFYKDIELDVAVLNITDVYIESKNKFEDGLLVKFIEKEMRADFLQMPASLGHQLLTVGYPYTIFDDYNLTPIVKSGTIASSYGRLFKGRPLFLIDCILYPGSSGSLVISSPSNSLQIGSQLMMSNIERFVVFGIYSGTPLFPIPDEKDPSTIKVDALGFGNVWYFGLIDSLIDPE